MRPILALDLMLGIIHDSQVVAQDWTTFGHGRNWTSEIQLGERPEFVVEWQQAFGEGRSQIVGREDRIYIASGSDQKVDEAVKITTQIRCVSLKTGDEIWKFESTGDKRPDQENFSGAPYSPQSTPLLLQHPDVEGSSDRVGRNRGSQSFRRI